MATKEHNSPPYLVGGVLDLSEHVLCEAPVGLHVVDTARQAAGAAFDTIRTLYVIHP